LKVSCPAHIDIEEVGRRIEDRLKHAQYARSFSRSGVFRMPGIVLSHEERKRVYIQVYKEFGCKVFDLK